MILDDKNYIAKKIKDSRNACGITQAELAEKINISTKQISRIEVGDFYPSLSTFLKIIETLNMDISDFINTSPLAQNKLRQKLLNTIYTATNEELEFYERLITFATDEIAEIKKNLTIKKLN